MTDNDYDMLAEQIADTLSNRNGSHGDPVSNHEHIAKLWNAYLDEDGLFSATDIAVCMILLKISRYKIGGHDPDHWRDIQGYSEIANMIEAK